MAYDEEAATAETQPRVNPAYAKYDGMTLTELGEKMVEVRRKLDEAKAKKTELEKEYDFLCTVKIPPAMEEEGLTNFKLASCGKGIRVQDEVFVSLPKEQFEQMKVWLQERNEDAIIQETINSSTLKAYITGKIKKGDEYPAELVNVTIVPKARFY